jgi:DNA-binding MarR family transcriptional regulator
MDKKTVSELSRSLIDIAWYFGPKGINGECCENLSMPEFLALDKISSKLDCLVQDVGILLGFTKSGATRIVNRLEKKGYIHKMKSLEDGRACCVEITEDGERMLKEVNSLYEKQFVQLLSKIPNKNESQTERVLKSIAEALNK